MRAFIHDFIVQHWFISAWVWLIAILLVLNHMIHLFNNEDDE